MCTLAVSEVASSEYYILYSVDKNIAIWTGLSRGLDDAGHDTMSKTSNVWKSADQGGATMLVAAFDPALTGMFQGSRPSSRKENSQMTT